MDTQIAFNKDGKPFNKFNEEIIKCDSCGGPTTMLGTKLCDGCWNAKGIFNSREVATLQIALDNERTRILDYRTGKHWTVEDKDNRLKEIDGIKQKVKALC